MYAIYPKIVLKGVTVDTGGLHVNLTVQRLVFDLLVTKLLVNVYTDVYRDGLVIHVRDIAVQGVLKTFATKMAPAPGDVIKIGRGIFVINAIPPITELHVPSHAVLIVYKTHVPMTRGFARMDAKKDSSEICVTRNAGSAQKAVTG